MLLRQVALRLAMSVGLDRVSAAVRKVAGFDAGLIHKPALVRLISLLGAARLRLVLLLHLRLFCSVTNGPSMGHDSAPIKDKRRSRTSCVPGLVGYALRKPVGGVGAFLPVGRHSCLGRWGRHS